MTGHRIRSGRVCNRAFGVWDHDSFAEVCALSAASNQRDYLHRQNRKTDASYGMLWREVRHLQSNRRIYGSLCWRRASVEFFCGRRLHRLMKRCCTDVVSQPFASVIFLVRHQMKKKA